METGKEGGHRQEKLKSRMRNENGEKKGVSSRDTDDCNNTANY